MPPRRSRRANRAATAFWALVLSAALWLSVVPARGDTWIDTHDDPAPAWEFDGTGEAPARLLARERVRLPASGQSSPSAGAERIAYAAPAGASAFAWRPVPTAVVIDELRVRLRGRSTAPGVWVVAEVALPHSKDANGQPRRLRIRSRPAVPGKEGDFEALLDAAPKRLADAARAWRLANRSDAAGLELRGAYVDRVAVGLPGVGGPAQAWLRELAVEGLVTPLHRTAEGVAQGLPEAPAVPSAPGAQLGGKLRATTVVLRGDGFLVDGVPYFPRLWRCVGEPFATLAARGVNTVWLDSPPTPQQRAEAAHHRLRIVCPPPVDPAAAAAEGPWERVLAWVLPGPLDANGLDAGLARIEATRTLPPEAKRPVVAHVGSGVEAGVEAWSRVADGLLLESDGGTSGAPPGAAVIPVVRLDVADEVAAQLDSLLGDALVPIWLPPQDVSQRVEAAIARSPAGIAFRATERLDSPDEPTSAAADWLEALNRRLRLVEPWLSGPRSAHPAGEEPGAVLVDRGGVRLGLRGPLDPAAPAFDRLPPTGTIRPLRLTPAGVSAWPAAGNGVAQRSIPGELLLSGDPRVVRSLAAYASNTGPAAAKNLVRLATVRVAATAALDPPQRRAAGERLSDARLAVTRRDAAAAYDAAYAAMTIVAEGESLRRSIAERDTLLESSPLTTLPATLTEHFRMRQLLASVPRGTNRLHGGDFEDIDALRAAGWRHPAPSDRAGAASVELAATDAAHGARVLRLVGGFPAAATRIVSPEVELDPREIFEVTGWVRIPAATGGELTIRDSLGGDPLALRLRGPIPEWTPFRLLRGTLAKRAVSIRLGVRGAITAEVDGLMLRAIEPVGLARRPTRTAANPGAQPK